MVKELNNNNFESEVLKSQGKVLVDFSATWCGPCKMLSPIVDAYAEAHAGELTVGKVDIDESLALAQTYQVMSVPTLILFEDGTPVRQSIGLIPAEALEQFVNG